MQIEIKHKPSILFPKHAKITVKESPNKKPSSKLNKSKKIKKMKKNSQKLILIKSKPKIETYESKRACSPTK